MADGGQFLDGAGLAVPLAGGLRETGNPWMPFELADADGGVVAPVAADPRPGPARGAPYSDGPVPPWQGRVVPSPAPATGPAVHPGRAGQRAVRPARLAPGPGAGRVLGLDRCPGLGAAGGDRRRR